MAQTSCEKDGPRRPACPCKIIWGIALPLLLALFILQAIVSRQGGGASDGVLTRRSAPGLGTVLTISVGGEGEAANLAHIDAAFARVRELEGVLSSWDAASGLSRLNRAQTAGAGAGAPVHPDLLRAIEIGKRWHGRTDGAFDIAAAPLIELWRTCGEEGRLPSDAELQAATSLTGASRLEIDPKGRTVRYPAPGMRLHLGGLGKGFCADEAVAVLKARGVASALVAMSGDIYALGRRPDGGAWLLGLQDPRAPEDTSAQIGRVYLVNRAVSTSGNYRRFVEIGGKRYSHIVDPRTGRTAEAVPSVTVIAPRAVVADILGTALSVLGVRDGLALVESLPEVEALFVAVGADDALTLTRSSGFAAYEAPPSPGGQRR
jgi:thiamine biosynthesis lipoprotein